MVPCRNLVKNSEGGHILAYCVPAAAPSACHLALSAIISDRSGFGIFISNIIIGELSFPLSVTHHTHCRVK